MSESSVLPFHSATNPPTRHLSFDVPNASPMSVKFPDLMRISLVKILSSKQQPPAGWIAYWNPTKPDKYFYNEKYRVIATDDITEELQQSVIEKAQRRLDGFSARCEVRIWGRHSYSVVNHDKEVLESTSNKKIGCSNDLLSRTAFYWTHINDFPFNRKLSKRAKLDALDVLEIALAQNIIQDARNTPFSKREAQECLQFFGSFGADADESDDRDPVAKTMMISHVLSNFYHHQLGEMPGTKRRRADPLPEVIGWTLLESITQIFSVIACCGIPPDYNSRFNIAYDSYQRSFQPDKWQLFLDQIRKERGDMNVVSGLLLSSSVAFLAVPNLVDISQCLIIISMGLSLSCVVMGLNAKAGEKLSEVEQISLQSTTERQRLDQLAEMARAMDQHTMILLLSILCFFLSLFVFTTWSIYNSVFGPNKTYTVKFVFYALAVAGLTAVAGVNLHWNRRFRKQ